MALPRLMADASSFYSVSIVYSDNACTKVALMIAVATAGACSSVAEASGPCVSFAGNFIFDTPACMASPLPGALVTKYQADASTVNTACTSPASQAPLTLPLSASSGGKQMLIRTNVCAPMTIETRNFWARASCSATAGLMVGFSDAECTTPNGWSESKPLGCAPDPATPGTPGPTNTITVTSCPASFTVMNLYKDDKCTIQISGTTYATANACSAPAAASGQCVLHSDSGFYKFETPACVAPPLPGVVTTYYKAKDEASAGTACASASSQAPLALSLYYPDAPNHVNFMPADVCTFTAGQGSDAPTYMRVTCTATEMRQTRYSDSACATTGATYALPLGCVAKPGYFEGLTNVVTVRSCPGSSASAAAAAASGSTGVAIGVGVGVGLAVVIAGGVYCARRKSKSGIIAAGK